MSQHQMCEKFKNLVFGRWEIICGVIPCANCVFSKYNKHHWKKWHKEVFKGVK